MSFKDPNDTKSRKEKIEEAASRTLEKYGSGFAKYGLGLSPEELEDIYNAVVQHEDKDGDGKKQGRIKKAYAKHRAKRAARKAIKNAVKKKVAKQAAQQALSKGASAAVAATQGALAANAVDTFGLSLLIAAALQVGIELAKFARHPIEESKKWGRRALILYIIIIAAVVFFFILLTMVAYQIILLLTASVQQERLGRLTRINQLTVTKTAPAEINNGQELTYTITVSHPGTPEDVIISDTIPIGTVYATSSGKVNCDLGPACSSASKKVTWSAKENGVTAPFTTSFTLTVLPARDIYVMNIANGIIVGAPGTPPGTQKPVTCTGVTCALKYVVAYNRISEPYGTRGGKHKGIDLAGAIGTPIYALEGGVAYDIHQGCTVQSQRGNSCGGGAGNYVFIRNPSGQTFQKYMHMQSIAPLRENQVVARGELLGYLGSTGDSDGAHLHFQMEISPRHEAGDPEKIIEELATIIKYNKTMQNIFKRLLLLISIHKRIFLPLIPLILFILMIIFLVIFSLFTPSDQQQENIQQTTPSLPVDERIIVTLKPTIEEPHYSDSHSALDIYENSELLEKKESLSDGTIRYTITSPVVNRPNIVIRDPADQGITFQRSVSQPNNTFLPNYLELHGQPEKIFTGSRFYGANAQTYVYPTQGLAFITNPQTNSIFEVQMFLPMSTDDYVKKYGEDIVNKVTPTP